MHERLLIMEKKERAATVIFNRPGKRNPLCLIALFHLNDLANFFMQEWQVLCLVLQCNGDRALTEDYVISNIIDYRFYLPGSRRFGKSIFRGWIRPIPGLQHLDCLKNDPALNSPDRTWNYLPSKRYSAVHKNHLPCQGKKISILGRNYAASKTERF